MATFTNDTDAPMLLPTLGLEVAPGETVEIPDPVQPEAFDSTKATIADVTEWVGTDHERAGQALAAEEHASKPRQKLIEQLAEMLAPKGTV